MESEVLVAPSEPQGKKDGMAGEGEKTADRRCRVKMEKHYCKVSGSPRRWRRSTIRHSAGHWKAQQIGRESWEGHRRHIPVRRKKEWRVSGTRPLTGYLLLIMARKEGGADTCC